MRPVSHRPGPVAGRVPRSPGGDLSRDYALTALSTKPNPIYADRGLTGTCRARQVAQALAACRSGRTLVVTELNRLARSVTRLKIPAAMMASGNTGTEVAERPAQHDPRLPRQAGGIGRLPRAGCATAAARPIRAPFQPTRPRTKAGSRGCRRDGRPGWHQARPGRPGFAQLRVPARNYWIDLPGVPGFSVPDRPGAPRATHPNRAAFLPARPSPKPGTGLRALCRSCWAASCWPPIYRARSVVYGIVIVVVVFSVVVQGSLVPAAARLLHVQMRAVEPQPWALGVRLRDEPEGVHQLTIPIAARKLDSGFDLGLLGFQAARSYSLIRPFRTGFRRIWHVPGSAAVTRGAGPGSGTRWPMP